MKFRVSGAPVAAALLRLMWLDPKRGRVARSAAATGLGTQQIAFTAGFRQKVTIWPASVGYRVYQRRASGPAFAAG